MSDIYLPKKTREERLEHIKQLIDNAQHDIGSQTSSKNLLSIAYHMDADDDALYEKLLKALQIFYTPVQISDQLLLITAKAFSIDEDGGVLWLSRTTSFLKDLKCSDIITRGKMQKLGKSIASHLTNNGLSSLMTVVNSTDPTYGKGLIEGLRMGAMASRRGNALSIMWKAGLIDINYCLTSYADAARQMRYIQQSPCVQRNSLNQIYHCSNHEEKDRLLIQIGLMIGATGTKNQSNLMRKFFNKNACSTHFHEVMNVLMGVLREDQEHNDKIKNLGTLRFRVERVFSFIKGFTKHPDEKSLALMKEFVSHPSTRKITREEIIEDFEEFLARYEKNLLNCHLKSTKTEKAQSLTRKM